MKFRFLFSLLLLVTLSSYSSGRPYLFKNHREGYNVYRIPAIVKTKSGKLLAFCEGRKNLFDHGDIDLVMKSSIDDGKTWSALTVVWNIDKNTCGNPSPIVDEVTGDVLVVATLNNAKVYVLRSVDEGKNWILPMDITTTVKDNSWQWYATGPVHAIQLKNLVYRNRIVVPCNHTVAGAGKHVSHIIYSDDSGFTWHKGGSVSAEYTDECTVAELVDGSLLLNMRNSDRPLPNRKVSRSKDGGNSWSAPVFDSVLVEPVCQGALLRYSYEPDVLLFSNPKHTEQRKNLTLSVSYDGAKTWIRQLSIFKQKSAYNDMVQLANGDVLCLFETGVMLPYSGIAVKLISADSIRKP
jgi:sialidase-1